MRLSSVPFGPINNIEQTFEHPQAKARNLVVEVEVCSLGSDKSAIIFYEYHFFIASSCWPHQNGWPSSFLQWKKDGY